MCLDLAGLPPLAALQEQLGPKLELLRKFVEFGVVHHVKWPKEN
jgi:hypothetical protein